MASSSATTEHVESARAFRPRILAERERIVIPAQRASSHTDPAVLRDPRYRMPFTSRVIPGLGAVALGIARGAI